MFASSISSSSNKHYIKFVGTSSCLFLCKHFCSFRSLHYTLDFSASQAPSRAHTLFKNLYTLISTVRDHSSIRLFQFDFRVYLLSKISTLKMHLSSKTLLALLPYFLQANALASGSGTTTRYWDCCKPSCAWPGKTALAAGATPVMTCDISDSPLINANAASGLSPLSSRINFSNMINNFSLSSSRL